MSRETESSQPLPPPPLPMRVSFTFTYTPEELAEGLKAAAKTRQPPRRKGTLVAWTIFVVLLIYAGPAIRGLRTAPSVQTTPATAPPIIDPWAVIVPSAVGAIVIGVLIMFSLLSVSASKKLPLEKRQPYIQRWLQIALGLIAVTVVVGISLLAGEPQTNWEPPRVVLIFLAFAPWLVLLFTIVGWGMAFGRRAARYAYDRRPGMRRERTIALDAAGLHNDDGMLKISSAWARYHRVLETPNTFALFDENEEVTVLPKRALIGETDLRTARALFNNHIADCTFLTSATGFEVTPLSVVALDKSGGSA